MLAMVLSFPMRVTAIRPSRMTRMRWQTAISSPASEELTTAQAPASAAARISLCRAALVAMSTPCVGSSSSSTLGSRRSHLPNRIFCWLPPLKLDSGSSIPVTGRTFSRLNQVRVSDRSARREIFGQRQCTRSLARTRFSRAVWPLTTALRRSGGR